MSWRIRFITAEHVRAHTAKKSRKPFKRVMQVYYNGSLMVQTILMGMEFDNTVDEMLWL